jgi:hypothetical protein
MSAEGDFLRAESRNIEQVLVYARELLAKPALNVHELTALGTFLHNAYSGVERILRCRLVGTGRLPKADASWHKDLLKQSLGASLLTESQYAVFLGLLRFRHYYVHGYGHLLDESETRQIAESALPVIGEFLSGVPPL